MKLNRSLSAIKNRRCQIGEEVTRAVTEILESIKLDGDAAVRRYCKKFDGFEGGFLVTQEEIDNALRNVDADFLRILRRAVAEITAFHQNQIGSSWQITKENGAVLGQLIRPIERVALYVPGGTAAYPSTVLMNAVPARLAGVEDIAIFTPVKADGRVNDTILAAAQVCGISTIYKIGGAVAVGVAAYGTQSIKKFDKIVGPGNIYVATAKRLVYGEIGIDMIAGPSEVLIIADESADPTFVAADLLSQAEHDRLASCMLLTTDESLIAKAEAELARQAQLLSRKNIIESALQDFGAAVLVADIDEAVAISNQIAPEHLEVLTKNPMELLPKIKNAGSIFLGGYTPEPLGDYISGTNHVLPTGGTARFYSPLGVYDFVKFCAYSYYSKDALANFGDDVIRFAEVEGLDAHANSIKVRFAK